MNTSMFWRSDVIIAIYFFKCSHKCGYKMCGGVANPLTPSNTLPDQRGGAGLLV